MGQSSGMLRERYGHMVHEYYVARLRAIMDARRARIEALRSREDAEVYLGSVRAKVRRVFSPLPRRTPLNTKVTGTELFSGFTIEKVVFQSRPCFFVTGNLYIPEGAGPRNRCPAALILCGHSPEGKSHSPYHLVCQGLASKGFIVLIIDPVSQGERLQYYPKDGMPLPDLCHSHNLMGNQMALLGSFLGTWRVWDAIRALDFVDGDAPFIDLDAGLAGDSQDTIAGGAFQYRAVKRRRDDFVINHEADIHRTHFFDVFMFGGIEPQYLSETLFVCFVAG